MNYGEVKSKFQKRLNRRDITASDVEGFVKGAILRTQRLLRTPASEALTEVTVGPGFKSLDIPGDLLKLVSITVDDGDELRRVSLTEARRAAQYPGIPRVFARNLGDFIIGPLPQEGAVITIVYSANFAALSGDADTNFLTEIAPDIIINGALSEACDHFNDPRGPKFEDNFVKAIIDLNNQAQEDELTNSYVVPSHSFDFGDEL